MAVCDFQRAAAAVGAHGRASAQLWAPTGMAHWLGGGCGCLLLQRPRPPRAGKVPQYIEYSLGSHYSRALC